MDSTWHPLADFDACLSDGETPAVRRPAGDTDWRSCLDLRWRVLRQPWNQPRGSERDPHDDQCLNLMIAQVDGLALATGRLHLNSPTEAQVRFMAVDPAWRNRRFGSRVLHALERCALRAGATRVILSARENAQPFYARHGYVVEGPGELLFGEIPHVRMARDL